MYDETLQAAFQPEETMLRVFQGYAAKIP